MERARSLFYHIVAPIAQVVFRILFRFSFINNPFKKLKGSYLILGHHVTEFDGVYVNFASGRLVRFLAGDANMDTPWKKHLFKFLGMVPFRKKKSDMKSIRQLMALVKSDHPIGLYPEGGQSWDGATDTLIPATAKFIKMMGIPVYVTFYHGGYLTRPRWSQYGRRGVIRFEAFQLMTAEDVKTLSVTEIFAKMQRALSYNAFEWQKENMIPFKGKRRAEYIERLLYKCPNCGALSSIHSENNDFSCDQCDCHYHMNTYGFIEGCDQFDDTHQWHEWQKSFIPDIAKTMTSYQLKNIVFEKRHSRTGERSTHECHMTITPEEILLECKANEGSEGFDGSEFSKGSEVSKGSESSENCKGHKEILSMTDTFGFSCTFRDVFEFYTTTYKYRFTFDPRRHLPIVFVLDLLNQLKENSKHE